MITLYGIPNCDTVKKARKWLADHGLVFSFHDFRKDGITTTEIAGWCDRAGIDTVLNRRGTTWRKLDSAVIGKLDNEALIRLMNEQPALIKRPVLEYGDTLLIGFRPEQYQTLL